MKYLLTGEGLWTLFMFLSAIVTSEATLSPPNTGNDWMSLSKSGLEFQPADLDMSDPRVQNAVEEAKGRMLGESRFYGQMAESKKKYYSSYAQAWRLLGFYIDCNASDGDGDDNENGSCMRYLLWAAYIDLDYQGGGLTEYSFWNGNGNKWDNSTCTSETRCVKMDCHLENSHFKLLGIFKEAEWDEWFEQLFKHEAYCLWTENQYYRMSTYRELWPEECTMTLTKDSDGNYLYYDIKPLEGGRIDIGLYTNKRCSTDYTGTITVDKVLSEMYNNGNNNANNNNDDDGNYGDNVYDLRKNIDRWNEAYDIFTQCQPCVAHSLPQRFSSSSENSNNWWNWGGGDDDGAYNGAYNNADEDSWDCDDDAGYNNVNQCMKFAYKTEMEAASFQDVVLASRQGSIADAYVFGAHEGFETTKQTKREKIIFAGSSVGLFIAGLFFIKRTLKSVYQGELQYPLVPSGTVA